MADNFQIIILNFFADFWWLISFIILFPLATNLWLWYKQSLYKKDISWIMLEIKPPREVKKTPKAMEQVLTALYSLRNAPGDFFEKWVDGEVTKWFSLEIASFGGETHFFARAPSDYKNIIEANFYAHYPDCSINVARDYTETAPATTREFYENGYDIFGSEFMLEKDDPYPIRTYAQFETSEDEQKIDPISAFLEGLGKLKRQENLWFQINIRPSDPKWKEKGEKLIQELRTKQLIEIKNAEGKTVKAPAGLTPGETDVIKAIENNISKPGFDTIIRVFYFAPKEIFKDVFPNKGVLGILNQYSAMNLNSFKHNRNIRTKKPSWRDYPHFRNEERFEGRKQRILRSFKNRDFPEELAVGRLLNLNPSNFNFFSKYFVLNTEELATIFHLPYYFVTTEPYISKVESKRAGPPAGLDIFRDE